MWALGIRRPFLSEASVRDECALLAAATYVSQIRPITQLEARSESAYETVDADPKARDSAAALK